MLTALLREFRRHVTRTDYKQTDTVEHIVIKVVNNARWSFICVRVLFMRGKEIHGNDFTTEDISHHNNNIKIIFYKESSRNK